MAEQGKQHHRRALGGLFAGAFLIGFSPIYVMLSPVGPTATAFYRVALAFPFLLMIHGGRRMRQPAPAPVGERLPLWMLALPGLFFACDIALWHHAIQYTTVSNATLLGNLAPLFVTLIAWRFFHEHITGIFLAGMLTALIGTMLLLGSSFRLSGGNVAGDMMAIVTAMLYSGYQLSINRLRRHTATSTLMLNISLVSSILLLPASLLLGESIYPAGGIALKGWCMLIGLALLSQVCGQGLIAWALKRLPAPFTSVTLLIQPVVATIAAWLILGQALTPMRLTGGAVVLAGIVLARQGGLPVNAKEEGKVK